MVRRVGRVTPWGCSCCGVFGVLAGGRRRWSCSITRITPSPGSGSRMIPRRCRCQGVVFSCIVIPTHPQSNREQHLRALLLPAGRSPAVLIASVDLGTHDAQWIGPGKNGPPAPVLLGKQVFAVPINSIRSSARCIWVARHPASHLVQMLGGSRDRGLVRNVACPGRRPRGRLRAADDSAPHESVEQTLRVLRRVAGPIVAVMVPCRSRRFGPLISQIRDGCPPEFPWRPYAGRMLAHDDTEQSRDRSRFATRRPSGSGIQVRGPCHEPLSGEMF